MKIQLFNAGKRFNRDWIFRKANYTFLPGHSYAITGANGTGKSTFLQALAGNLEINEGTVTWQTSTVIDSNEIYKHLTIAAPYLELIEELTATEFLNFHWQFKTKMPAMTTAGILELIGLDKAANRQIRYYSSGMKQRLKLAQAIFADVPLLLLDEPCTNLDASGYQLYNELMEKYTRQKTVVISSNDAGETSFCTHFLNMSDYKS